MKQLDCCLTIVFPKGLEENMIDHLLETPRAGKRFYHHEVEGPWRRCGFPQRDEQVRGRANRVKMRMVMNHEDAAR